MLNSMYPLIVTSLLTKWKIMIELLSKRFFQTAYTLTEINFFNESLQNR